MKIKSIVTVIFVILFTTGCNAQKRPSDRPAQQPEHAAVEQTSSSSTVYMTSDISPEGLVRVYEALGIKAEGRVAVKISTGESEHSNYLRPELIKKLVQKVNGTLV